MNISLTPQLTTWIEQQISTGPYSSHAEVIEEALLNMAKDEEAEQGNLELLKKDIQSAIGQIEEGRVIDFDTDTVESIKAEARKAL